MLSDTNGTKPFTAAEQAGMRLALAEAAKAEAVGEVPIGCVILLNGQLLAAAHNLRETSQEVWAHAEMLALRQANVKQKSWRLDGAEVYVTLEPCPMCAAALQQARIKKVYFACRDPKAGAVCSTDHFFARAGLNHRVEWTEGPLTDEASALLKDFFRRRRARNKALNKKLGGRGARKALMETQGPALKAAEDRAWADKLPDGSAGRTAASSADDAPSE